MELVFRIILFISGIVNILPFFLTFLPEKISKSYGIQVLDMNYELLLRHRAVLFGIIGGILIFSSLTKKYYDLSTMVGLVSMVSFIILYFLIGNINMELKKIMLIDVVASLTLFVGALLYFFIFKKIEI